MSLEYCSKCGKEFLTEADEYMVTPIDNYALTCYRCIGAHVNKKTSKEALEASDLLKKE
jgi:hypothetical protein